MDKSTRWLIIPDVFQRLVQTTDVIPVVFDKIDYAILVKMDTYHGELNWNLIVSGNVSMYVLFATPGHLISQFVGCRIAFGPKWLWFSVVGLTPLSRWRTSLGMKLLQYRCLMVRRPYSNDTFCQTCVEVREVILYSINKIAYLLTWFYYL